VALAYYKLVYKIWLNKKIKTYFIKLRSFCFINFFYKIN
jgi:hypothetical protein